MKATALTPRRNNNMSAIRGTDGKVTKAKETNDIEMAACFSKLKDLVPTIPQDKKLSKVAFLQHVIDYILDLEVTLEYHPASVSQKRTERVPLADKTQLNMQHFLQQVCSYSRVFACKKV